MSRLSRILAVIAAVILVASSGAHSLLGWPGLRDQLRAANVSAELVGGLAMGWHFGGMAMLVFGLLVLWMLRDSRSTTNRARTPLLLLGIAYLSFGIACVVALGWTPFLLVFLVPGALLSAAAVLSDSRAANA